jgi:hypothetical protein
MARSKTARHKKTKRHTMRKPRTLLHVTEENLDTSGDPNVKWNLMSSFNERQEYKAEQEAREKFQAVPKGTFRFVVKYNTLESIHTGRMVELTTRPLGRPIRAMDFLQLIPEDERETELTILELRILYKGVEPEDSYYCLVKYIPDIYRYNDEYNNNDYRFRRQRGQWLAFFLPPLDFFKDDIYVGNLPNTENRFWYWHQMVRFVRNLPYLEEKARREESAIESWRESLLRHQRRMVKPMALQFERATKQTVPENVEGVIRSFI